MAMMPGNDTYISGRRAIPRIIVWVFVFTILMSILTWGAAKLLTPYFVEKERQRREALKKVPLGELPDRRTRSYEP